MFGNPVTQFGLSNVIDLCSSDDEEQDAAAGAPRKKKSAAGIQALNETSGPQRSGLVAVLQVDGAVSKIALSNLSLAKLGLTARSCRGLTVLANEPSLWRQQYKQRWGTTQRLP